MPETRIRKRSNKMLRKTTCLPIRRGVRYFVRTPFDLPRNAMAVHRRSPTTHQTLAAICADAKVPSNKKLADLSDDEIVEVLKVIPSYCDRATANLLCGVEGWRMLKRRVKFGCAQQKRSMQSSQEQVQLSLQSTDNPFWLTPAEVSSIEAKRLSGPELENTIQRRVVKMKAAGRIIPCGPTWISDAMNVSDLCSETTK